MANYCCTIRTNYFHVKDEGKFLELMDQVQGSEDQIKLFQEKGPDGKNVFGFGLYGGIAGVANDEGDMDDHSYVEFINRLQKCVADDDAVIIMESGAEKLRYVVGSATVITSNDCEYLNIDQLAAQKASSMLGNPVWSTRCEM